MIIKKEVCSSCDFEFWGGAVETVETLTEWQFETVLQVLDEVYPDGLTEDGLNTFSWFENDTIAEWLGFSNWEELEAQNA